MPPKQIIYSLSLPAIISLSFSLYSLYFFKGINSDHAMHALMAETFDFQKDWYYRGQDRLGSIIPLLAWPLVKLGMNAVWAVSLSQYLLLTASYNFLKAFFTSRLMKLCLALLIFLPLPAFLTQVFAGHPYIGQLFFVGAFLWLFFKSPWPTGIRNALAGIAAFGALWSSDISAAFFLAFVLVFWRSIFQQFKKWQHWVPGVAGLLLGASFRQFAKRRAKDEDLYNQLIADSGHIWTAIEELGDHIVEMATFDYRLPGVPIAFYLAVFSILLSLLFIRKKFHLLFLLAALLTAILVLLSHWSAMMGFPPRYYSTGFFFLMLSVLLVADERKWLIQRILLPLTMVSVGLAGVHYTAYYDWEVDDRLKRSQAIKLASKGDYAVIASYWNSYLVDAWSRDVIATPHDQSYLRHTEIIPAVMASDSIMVIKNGFLDDLPDSLEQFNRSLYKISKTKKLDEFEYAFYQQR